VERPDPAIDKRLSDEELRLGALQDRLPRYFDGRHSAFEIARAAGVSFDRMAAYLRGFAAKDLVSLSPVDGLDEYRRLSRLPDMSGTTGPSLPKRRST
jgi:hypothetical protein